MTNELSQGNNEQELASYHAQVKEILQGLVGDYFIHWPKEHEALKNFRDLSVSEQIRYEQDIVIRAVHLEYIKQREIADSSFRLGRYLRFKEYDQLQEQKDLLKRRSNELDELVFSGANSSLNSSGIWEGSLLPESYLQ